MPHEEGNTPSPFTDGSVDVITGELLLPGAAKITTLAASPAPMPGTCQAKLSTAELHTYLNPRTFQTVAGVYWKSVGFRHPVTSEYVHMGQVELLWPDAHRYRHAARTIEASFIRFKKGRQHKLAALKFALDDRAVYDELSRANLVNTVKYSAVAELLWPFVVPAEGNPSSIAGKALLYASKIRHGWLHNSWASVGTFDGHYNGYCWGDFEAELWWLNSHSAAIDKYAAEGTHPTRHLTWHLTRQRGVYGYAKDSSISRNLNRLLDAVTCYAYWSTIRQHEIAGTVLMRNRLTVAIGQDACTRNTLGSMACLPPELLQMVLNQFHSIDTKEYDEDHISHICD